MGRTVAKRRGDERDPLESSCVFAAVGACVCDLVSVRLRIARMYRILRLAHVGALVRCSVPESNRVLLQLCGFKDFLPKTIVICL